MYLISAGMNFIALQAALKKGMESLSQAEVGSALQIYFNLGTLKEVCTRKKRPKPITYNQGPSRIWDLLFVLKYLIQAHSGPM